MTLLMKRNRLEKYFDALRWNGSVSLRSLARIVLLSDGIGLSTGKNSHRATYSIVNMQIENNSIAFRCLVCGPAAWYFGNVPMTNVVLESKMVKVTSNDHARAIIDEEGCSRNNQHCSDQLVESPP